MNSTHRRQPSPWWRIHEGSTSSTDEPKSGDAMHSLILIQQQRMQASQSQKAPRQTCVVTRRTVSRVEKSAPRLHLAYSRLQGELA
eukprot:6103453-Pleurochrysis_carterae.AAC.1